MYVFVWMCVWMCVGVSVRMLTDVYVHINL